MSARMPIRPRWRWAAFGEGNGVLPEPGRAARAHRAASSAVSRSGVRIPSARSARSDAASSRSRSSSHVSSGCLCRRAGLATLSRAASLLTLQPKMRRYLWDAVCERLQRAPGAIAQVARFGNPVLIEPRLGQGAFRVAVAQIPAGGDAL